MISTLLVKEAFIEVSIRKKGKKCFSLLKKRILGAICNQVRLRCVRASTTCVACQATETCSVK